LFLSIDTSLNIFAEENGVGFGILCPLEKKTLGPIILVLGVSRLVFSVKLRLSGMSYAERYELSNDSGSIFILKMATAMFAEKLDNSQYSMQLIPKRT
jgi:hypothetical protein